MRNQNSKSQSWIKASSNKPTFSKAEIQAEIAALHKYEGLVQNFDPHGLSLSATAVAGSAATAAPNPNTTNAIVAAVNKELAAYGGPQPVPGAVIGVWLPGKVAFAQGFGEPIEP